METTEFDFTVLPIKCDYIGVRTNADKWEHHLWSVTLSWKNGFHTFDYRCGMAHQTKPKTSWMKPIPIKPDNKSIMYSLLMDSSAADESFMDWCTNYGYSDDSIGAFNIYRACCETAVFLRKAFSASDLQAMRIALEDF
jgi:hypothetical protein